MFGKRITLFKLFGFEVRLDMSWIIIAILITWSLGSGFFPYRYPGFSKLSYWLMGAVGAVGLFFSIVFHELCHSLVARGYGIPMKGITLFIFGGVAEMGDEPPSPKIEFQMSVVGPLSSIAIGLVFYGLFILGMRGVWPMQVNAVLEYLAAINILLACFNLIPAFPLDGGRILRSILWKVKNDIRWATRISSMIGSGFGYLLIAFAIYSLLIGNFIGAVWWFLIGMFIRGAAQMSYQQLLLRRALEGEPVSRFMKKDPVTVSPAISIRQFVDDYLLHYHFKMYPVVEDGRLIGCITSGEVKKVPRDAWQNTTVGEATIRVCAENSVGPETDSVEAIALMRRTGNSRMMITDGEKLLGILALKDLLEFLSMKVELGD
jgi:Zn-dependent protease/CBS domain-containing protein